MAKKKVKVIDYGMDFVVNAVGLVDKPAIESNFICLSKARGIEKINPMKFATVQEGERRMLFGPVMIPDVLILRYDTKKEEEFYVRFSKELVRKLAHDFLKNHSQGAVTLMHGEFQPGVVAVETWVKEYEADKSTALKLNAPIGSWIAGYECANEQAWQLAKEGILNGFSIEGQPGEQATESEVEIEVDDEEDRFLVELEEILSA